MKYEHSIEIDLPRERVVELMDSVENLYKWQPGLTNVEAISGVQGQEGAKMKLIYENGPRKMIMVETITKRDFPNEFSASYEAKNVFNRIENQFIEIGDNKTKWIAKNEFLFNGLMMKLMGAIVPGAFKKQSFKYMKLFKEFAEKEG